MKEKKLYPPEVYPVIPLVIMFTTQVYMRCTSYLKCNWVTFLCVIQIFFQLAEALCPRANGIRFLPPQKHANEGHCVHLTLCIVSPRDSSCSGVHGIQVHGYFARLARAFWCLGGKDVGFGPRDGVCSRDEREAAGSWAVGLFLFHLWA